MSIDVARANLQRYGDFPVAMTFANNDNVTDLPDTADQMYSAAFDPSTGIKRHAACDECRKRKLKCSGEPTGCSRCVKQNLICHYSEQKQMGRPRKRQKTETESSPPSKQAPSPPRPIQPAPELTGEPSFNGDILDPSLSFAHDERAQFENICNGPIAQSIRSSRKPTYQDHSTPGLQSTNSDTSHSHNGASTPTPDQFDPFTTAYPTDIANWPDFSTLDILPLPVEDKWQPKDNDAMVPTDPDVNLDALSNLPSVPACPCLPNLYLTLSTMSTLSSFPFTPQTIKTIESAYLTAKGVIYCPVCPQKFDTGSSNLMLGCTLLNVLGDQWHRFRRLSVEDVRKSFGTPEQQQSFITTKEGLAWRVFAHNIIRAYVFGDQPAPPPPGSTPTSSVGPALSFSEDASSPLKFPSTTLLSLCDALTRRQRQWHRLDEVTDEFPDRVNADLMTGHLVGETPNASGRHLCLEIISQARCILGKLDGPAPT